MQNFRLGSAVNQLLDFIGCPFVGFCGRVDYGAVRDLRPDSQALFGLAATTVAGAAPMGVHAIVGVGGATDNTFYSALEDILSFFGYSREVIFKGSTNDLIVGSLSQTGGLDATTRPFPVNHLSGTENSEAGRLISNHIIDLLNTPVATSSAFAQGFPQAFGGNPPLCQDTSQAIALSQGGGIQISMPAAGTPIPAGEVIDVVVEPFGGYEPASVLLVGGDEVLIDEKPPIQFEAVVPLQTIGSLALQAYARDVIGQVIASEEVQIEATVKAKLAAIEMYPPELDLFAWTPTQGVLVIGHFDDGITRDLTRSSLSTVYHTLNPAVATVSEQGLVGPISVGMTSLTATYAGQAATIPVTVVTAPLDSDSNRRIDLRDYSALAACFSGSQEALGFALPPVECRDFFDRDSDTDIDLDDFAKFHDRITGR